MDATQRFSDRAEVYHLFRPRYPDELLGLLREKCGLNSKAVVADIGSGTGILAELFLRNGNVVFGVEPNEAMRVMAERQLAKFAGFRSVDGRAEATTLASESADFVVAGQAFHWFDRERAAAEFARILRPEGWIILVWNERLTDASPFAGDYEQLLLDSSIDYRAVDPKQVSGDREALDQFFRKQGNFAAYRHTMPVTFEQLSGFLSSASYAPTAGHPKHGPMMEQLRSIFETHQRSGVVPLEFDMKVYYGRRFELGRA